MTRQHYIIDRAGEVKTVSAERWAEWMERADRVVEQTRVGHYTVSTVFLGLDHNFSAEGPPLLWETMIFDSVTGEFLDYQERYASNADALAGHTEAVKYAMNL